MISNSTWQSSRGEKERNGGLSQNALSQFHEVGIVLISNRCVIPGSNLFNSSMCSWNPTTLKKLCFLSLSWETGNIFSSGNNVESILKLRSQGIFSEVTGFASSSSAAVMEAKLPVIFI